MDRNTYRGRGFVRVQRFPERYEKTAFVYGDFHKDYDGSLYHFITQLPDLDTDDWQTKQYNVEANTVTQCTGLKDKNDNPIFEGDYFIYKKHPKYTMDSFIGQVVWIEESACFGYIKLKGSYNFIPTPFAEHDELKHDVLNFLEVVGNIFDNKIDELVAQHSI